MYNRNDPRFRRTLNQISQNLESANEQAQVGLFSVTEHYLKPCIASLNNGLRECTAVCFPTTLQQQRKTRRQRTRPRGRAELSFDFYDDWAEDDEEADALLGAEENDEFDRLLGGYEGASQQPGWQANMNYGSRGEAARPLPRARRKSAVLPYDGGPDPTIIPNQSYFGFLTKLPFKIGRRALRYRPSAEGLQDRAKGKGRAGIEALDDSDEEEGDRRVFGRKRSRTAGSGHTTDSYSSRGDIFPSDDEDAVPLDDEFDEALVRTDTSSGKTKMSKRTRSSKSTRRSDRKSSGTPSDASKQEQSMEEIPTMSALQHEELRAGLEEDEEVEKKRLAAQRLAEEHGLVFSEESTEQKPEELVSPVSELASPDTTPFPAFNPDAAHDTTTQREEGEAYETEQDKSDVSPIEASEETIRYKTDT